MSSFCAGVRARVAWMSLKVRARRPPGFQDEEIRCGDTFHATFTFTCKKKIGRNEASRLCDRAPNLPCLETNTCTDALQRHCIREVVALVCAAVHDAARWSRAPTRISAKLLAASSQERAPG